MLSFSGDGNTNLIIRRPPMGAIVDAFSNLLHLPRYGPSGFFPGRHTTLAETIIDKDGTGIGPLTISTTCNQLFCYTVRYESQRLGIMLVMGKTVCHAMANNSIPESIEMLCRGTLLHGPIVFHSLLTVATPHSSEDFRNTNQLFRDRGLLFEEILKITKLGIESPPRLTLPRVVLSGWSSREASLPVCTLSGGSSLWMHIQWGRDPSKCEHIKIA